MKKKDINEKSIKKECTGVYCTACEELDAIEFLEGIDNPEEQKCFYFDGEETEYVKPIFERSKFRALCRRIQTGEIKEVFICNVVDLLPDIVQMNQFVDTVNKSGKLYIWYSSESVFFRVYSAAEFWLLYWLEYHEDEILGIPALLDWIEEEYLNLQKRGPELEEDIMVFDWNTKFHPEIDHICHLIESMNRAGVRTYGQYGDKMMPLKDKAEVCTWFTLLSMEEKIIAL